MNFLTYTLHILTSGAAAYISARHLRDPQTRPNVLAGFQLAEAGSVPFLEALSRRAAAEGDPWLSDRLSRHAADERRHAQIFAHGLKQLGKQVIDFQPVEEKQADKQPDEQRRSPFFEAYFKDYSSENLKPDQIDWIVFMASTNILELDASKDFARMANTLPENELRSAALKKGMLSIANDETGHAAYLYEALERRLPAQAVVEVVDGWRSRKVNALMAMVGNLFHKGGKLPSMVQDGAPVDMSETAIEQAPELQVA